MSRRRVPNESSRSGRAQAARPEPQADSSTFNLDAHNMSIGGGEFNNTQGHRTNLTIYVNPQSPSRDGNNSNQPSASSYRNTTREMRSRVPEPENSASSQLPVQQSNLLYQRHLELKGFGFPLWIPSANRNLSIQYRRTGVRIGDVGIITPNGGFSFLFNICRPRNDPINPLLLPDNFSPISEATEIDNFVIFGDGSHLASTSVEKAQANSQSSGFQFESSASEGAILTMPLGATSESLGNTASFREYAASNLVQWYKFVNGVLGREAKNGDIRLVIGSVKTTSWGIATFANQARHSSCRLSFCPVEVPSSSDSSRYVWEYSGIADVKAGPSQREKNELRHGDESGDVIYENQCLFLRTMNPKLSPSTWSEINCDQDSGDLQLQGDLHPARDSASAASSINRTSALRNQSRTPSSQSSHRLGNRTSLNPHSELHNNSVTFDDESTVLDSDPLSTLISHPSNALNDILLAMESVPSARMVITDDEHWSSVASKCDTFPNTHELLEQNLVSHRICEEDGVVFLDQQAAIESIVSTGQEIILKNQHAPPQDTSTYFPVSREKQFTASAPSAGLSFLQQQSEEQTPNPSSPDIMIHTPLPPGQDNKDTILGHDPTFREFVDDRLRLPKPSANAPLVGLSTLQWLLHQHSEKPSSPDVMMNSSSDQDNKDNILRHDHIFKQEFVDSHVRLSRPPPAGLSDLQRSEKPAPNPSNPDIVMHSSPVYNKDDILGHNLQHSEKQASNPSNPDVVMHSPLSSSQDNILGDGYGYTFMQDSVDDPFMNHSPNGNKSLIPFLMQGTSLSIRHGQFISVGSDYSSSPSLYTPCLTTSTTPASTSQSFLPSPTVSQQDHMQQQESLFSNADPDRPRSYTHREQQQLFREALSLHREGAGPFIPQLMYKPHTTSDRKRYVEDFRLEGPIYFVVEHPDQCGIPLNDALHSRVKSLANREHVVFEGRGPSVSIRLEWPGYRQWSRQIPTKDFRSPPGPITVAKLAKNVAKCVQRFMQDRKLLPMEEGFDVRWRIGEGPNDIKLEDLMLVSIHHVSLGSWQPHLRLRRPQSNIPIQSSAIGSSAVNSILFS